MDYDGYSAYDPRQQGGGGGYGPVGSQASYGVPQQPSSTQLQYPQQQQQQAVYGNPYSARPVYSPTAPPVYGDAAGYGQYPGGYRTGPPPLQQQQQQFGGFAAPAMLQDPMVQNMAMQYGQTVLGQGGQAVAQSVEKYVSLSRLKYYFAVDTAYVARKLRLLVFPYTNSDWSIRYNSEEPIQPRHEVNAPDLYIPSMAFITYILVAGFLLGRQQRFSPELLGIQFSSALCWLVFEVGVVLLTIYVLNTGTGLRVFDLLAFSGYKYVSINLCLLSSLFLDSTGFLAVLVYCCAMCSLFLVRTLKVQLQPAHENVHGAGLKRRMYILLLVAGIQPPLIYWLSYHLVHFPAPLPGPPNTVV